ncbi:LysM peptidoglycan-binding domain-containing protein [Desulfobulbus alkaliphilus]|uniref:LysM peptidoglycan-binding domain-containing protein n=1 Tax=Desulfobulbus alkaliphilus TaxID=869814 RepID=UPI00196643A7|nr:LysM peptidoglycan-binding domain-containing protein [Desulfobulbus alkaliphilus]MBM9538009.1 LysM peptidoglycan-binding domain-containing protein [Desulfobulbus alkaliphilus]
MKRIFTLLAHACVAIVLLSLTACAPQLDQSTLDQHAARHHVQDSETCTDEGNFSLSMDPDQWALEDLAVLNDPDFWEFETSGEQSASPVQTGFDLSSYDFPITINKQVLYFLELFQGRHRNTFSQWLARSTIYLPSIQSELKQAGLPLDLAYLAMIESGYNPSAYSHAHAAGLWQFIPGTGRDYGLRIDSWVDERREPEKATKAAIQYLSRLYRDFDDWYLAVAAYNGGENRVERAIQTYNTRCFWELAGTKGIYLETKQYVPKLIAAILIARQPEKFGFTDIQYQKPVQYDLINVPGGTDLEAVAVSASTTVKLLRTLNNELNRNQTPPRLDQYTLRIPAGSRNLVAANLEKLVPVTTTTFVTHTVKSGDTLTSICNYYNINKTTLLKANNLRTASLRRGHRLQIPTTTTRYVLLKDGESMETLLASGGSGNRHMVLHQIKPGDTLSKIALQYQVPTQTIMLWNNISNPRTIRAGQQIALYLDRPAPEAMTVIADAAKMIVTPVASAPATTDLLTLSDTKKRSAQAPEPQQLAWYVVQRGDSLWTIARKFQVSTQDLRQWNNLNSTHLQVGNRLIVRKG